MENKKVLSVFVDESGVLSKDDSSSRFYLITLVTHDQAIDISNEVKRLDAELDLVGIANLYFHAGPIIHAHDHFSFMNWDLRRKIFYRMLAFANRIPFRYACLIVDKKFADTTGGIVENLERQLSEVVDSHRLDLSDYETVKVYYDCGQKPVTNLLHQFFASRTHIPVVFAQAVDVARYKLIQIADLICTLKLIEMKIACGMAMSKSEIKFFGGRQLFQHNVLRIIKRKEIV